MKFGQNPKKEWKSASELGNVFNPLGKKLNRLLILDHVWKKLVGNKYQICILSYVLSCSIVHLVVVTDKEMSVLYEFFRFYLRDFCRMVFGRSGMGAGCDKIRVNILGCLLL